MLDQAVHSAAVPPPSVDHRPSYLLTRLAFLRLLGGIYFIAFLGLVKQLRPLIGRDGLLPAQTFLAQVAAAAGSRGAGFWELPSLFWLSASDRFMQGSRRAVRVPLHVLCQPRRRLVDAPPTRDLLAAGLAGHRGAARVHRTTRVAGCG